MTSEIRVDKIHNEGGDNDSGIDLSTNDQIVLKTANTTRLTMNATGQTTIVGEGGTNTTNLQQGLAKCWVNFNGTGTIATRDSFNESTLTDTDTGDYRVNFTSSMSSVNYTATTSGKASESHARGGAHVGAFQVGNNYGNDTDAAYTAAYFRIGSAAASSSSENGSIQDIDAIDLTIHGDLA